MCGRYSLTTPVSALQDLFNFSAPLPNLAPRFNIAPTQGVVVVRQDADGTRILDGMRWGLVPSWSKDGPGGKPLINARSETLLEKPSFQTAAKRRRCLVPADGFFEWQTSQPGKGTPYFISRPEGGVFAMAGLWEAWMSKDGSELFSMAIVTAAANATLQPFHHRMPVVITPENFALWLDCTDETDLAGPLSLLKPAPDTYFHAYPVSKAVNKISNDGPELLERAKPDEERDQPEQFSLF